jgi:hypothetical protein
MLLRIPHVSGPLVVVVSAMSGPKGAVSYPGEYVLIDQNLVVDSSLSTALVQGKRSWRVRVRGRAENLVTLKLRFTALSTI